MSSAKRHGQAAAESSEASRLAKGKAVDDGESSGKRTRVARKPSNSVVGVPAQAKRPQLRTKRTTRFFLRILKSLNERQKTVVRQLGFGGLLDFDVASVPGTLAYWLLEHFNHPRSFIDIRC